MSENPCVLLVDYDPKNIKSLTELFSSSGYRVQTVNDGLTAISTFKEIRPDIVLIEAMIPKKHGFEVCQEIKKTTRGKTTPVIIMTAVYKGRKYRTQAMRVHGCDEYIEKPCPPETILELVTRFVPPGKAIAGSVSGPAESAIEGFPSPRTAQAHASKGAAESHSSKGSGEAHGVKRTAEAQPSKGAAEAHPGKRTADAHSPKRAAGAHASKRAVEAPIQEHVSESASTRGASADSMPELISAESSSGLLSDYPSSERRGEVIPFPAERASRPSDLVFGEDAEQEIMSRLDEIMPDFPLIGATTQVADAPAAVMVVDAPAAVTVADAPAAVMVADAPAAVMVADAPTAVTVADAPAAVMAADPPAAAMVAAPALVTEEPADVQIIEEEAPVAPPVESRPEKPAKKAGKGWSLAEAQSQSSDTAGSGMARGITRREVVEAEPAPTAAPSDKPEIPLVIVGESQPAPRSSLLPAILVSLGILALTALGLYIWHSTR